MCHRVPSCAISRKQNQELVDSATCSLAATVADSEEVLELLEMIKVRWLDGASVS